MSRVAVPGVTEERLRSVIPRVPISRISDLTPLDPLRLPVFAAVTPLARDLTTHMGKGKDAQAARVSAIMEAVERVSAESPPPGSTVRASFLDLEGAGRRPVDPVSLDLPSDTSYRPDREITWIESRDLGSGDPVLLPLDLAINPPVEGVLRDVDSNGLASGNTHLEAVIHALGEIIERDVYGQLEFLACFGDPHAPRPFFPPIDFSSLSGEAAHWVERLHSQKLSVVIQETTGDIRVPTFRTILSDFSYPSSKGPVTLHTPGWGTALHAEAALLRSITEAVQTRLGVIQAARDAIGWTHAGRRAFTRGDHLRQMLPAHRVPFASASSVVTTDLREDLAHLLDRLAQAGFRQVIATDLTRPDLGIPVVRVRVPGLTAFSVNRRRVGWRCLRHLL